MKIINLTPHDVNICDEFGNVIKTYYASGMVARIGHDWKVTDYIDGISIVERKDEKVENLPEPQEGVYYIVSNIILEYCWGRSDLLAPVRQVKRHGQVIGCRSFIREI